MPVDFARIYPSSRAACFASFFTAQCTFTFGFKIGSGHDNMILIPFVTISHLQAFPCTRLFPNLFLDFHSSTRHKTFLSIIDSITKKFILLQSGQRSPLKTFPERTSAHPVYPHIRQWISLPHLGTMSVWAYPFFLRFRKGRAFAIRYRLPKPQAGVFHPAWRAVGSIHPSPRNFRKSISSGISMGLSPLNGSKRASSWSALQTARCLTRQPSGNAPPCNLWVTQSFEKLSSLLPGPVRMTIAPPHWAGGVQ